MKGKTKRKKFKYSSSSSQNSESESSDLHTAVIKIAVAQICNSVGYRGAQTSALETLTGVAVTYLQSLAKSAAISASSTGRTQCNIFDIIRGLEDLHSDVGFHGNSDIKKRLYKLTDSSILRDTMKFVYLSREIPFAKPLPRRCHTVTANPTCFDSESVKWNHVPRWLPAFPKIADVEGKTVIPTLTEDVTESEKRESNKEISKLPERRKKVSFRIGGGRNRNVIEIDLRSGVCKGGKRISCLNASCSSIHDPELMKNVNSD